jgi:molecular chaperone HscB
MDPFATLGIARSYAVDLAAVERTHRELSRALHPDKFVGATASERVVRDPIRRAEALLALAGVAVGEDREPKADPEFLMEMLEQREALSEAKAAKDLGRVHAMAQSIEARAAEVERALAEGFARGESASLVGRLGELRFYRRFLDEVSAIEDELAA